MSNLKVGESMTEERGARPISLVSGAEEELLQNAKKGGGGAFAKKEETLAKKEELKVEGGPFPIFSPTKFTV